MAISSLVLQAAETGATGPNPWFIGGSLLFVFVALMMVLLMFGAGRDHS